MKTYSEKELDQMIDKSRRYSQFASTKCLVCGSEKISTNRAKTTFCLDCNYCVSARRNVSRMVGHALHEKHGYLVKTAHPDGEIRWKVKK